MRIIDLINPNGMNLDFKSTSKLEAVDQLVDLMDRTGNLSNKELYKKAILKREEQGSTGIGEGIAIPHAKNKAVKKATVAVARSVDGVDYESLDGEVAKLFFMIAAPEGGENVHLEVLERLSALLMDEELIKGLLTASGKKEFLALINDKEMEKFPEEASKKLEQANVESYKVLAVTACPTGIAHTFMAAESLQNKAKELGIPFKVETNGSAGAKNVLTKEEIAKADCIIIAADKKVEMQRFEGKKVIITKVSDGIHKAEALLDRAVNGQVPIYHHAGTNNEDEKVEGESIGRQVYKHLMNGVSHMLPFVTGGGILIALAFMFDDFNINPSSFGSNTPLAAFFNSTGGAAFGFMLPILAGYIALSIGERPALVVGFVGGHLANTGGAGFLGALLAGFIAGYVVKYLVKLCSGLPRALEGVKPTLIYPLVGTLTIGILMKFVIIPPVAALNGGIADFLNNMGTTSQILLGVIVAAMMATDMGGPINKAAYVFGLASLEAGNYGVMAAVMAGGMVPPLAIAISTTLFKNKFTKREKDAGLTNYVMGLSFITEGAIPFAASDPARVLPACAIGSAIAGALSMAFGCGLMAPHGGLFVILLIENKWAYVAAVLIGSLVGAVILGLLKKPVDTK